MYVSGSIGRIGMRMVGRKIAAPHPRAAPALAQFHSNGNEIAQHAAMHVRFAKFMLDPATASESAGKINVCVAWVDLHSRTPGSRQNPPPVWIGAGEHRFYQRGSCDRACDLSRGSVACRSAYFDLDHTRGALAVGDNLQCERATHVFEGFHKAAIICIGPAYRSITGSAAGERKKRVICGRISVDGDGV